MAKYSKYTGVSFDKKKGKWFAAIKNNGKGKFLGYAETEDEAYQKRLAAENEMADILSKNITKKKKDKVLQLYTEGLSINEIATRLGKHYSTIYEQIKNSNLEMRDDRLSDEIKEDIISKIVPLYKSGLSFKEVSEASGFKSGTVARLIKQQGESRPARKYFFKDEHFLKNINEEWKAYFLGLLWADGNMRTLGGENNKSCSVNISLVDTDSYLFSQLAEKIFVGNIKLHQRKSTRYINKLNGKEYWSKPSSKFTINSKIVYQDLLDLGCHPKKSLTIEIPAIPEKYLCDFVRGYFDGDGWITTNNTFGMIGSHIFCEQMKTALEKMGIKCRIVLCDKVSRLISCNYDNLQKFHDFIYQSDSIHMTRKKERIQASLAKRKIKTPK